MKFLLLLERSLLVIFWVLLIFGFDSPDTAVLTIISALIHELGHVVCLLVINSKEKLMPTPHITGFRIKIPSMSYKEELLCALSGPMANLAVGIILFLPFPSAWSSYFKIFVTLNIMTMISNLMPIEGYDGYKILNAIFGIFFNCNALAQNLLFLISLLTSSIMCFLSLYIILKSGAGYWIFAVFFSVMLRSMTNKQKQDIF